MIKQLPGTLIQSDISSAHDAKVLLDNMFIMDGMVLSQVTALTGLEPYMVQNWVQRHFMTSPVRKLYSKNQFCRIATINALRGVLQIDKITAIISYVNGALDDDSDNILPDSLFYIYFIASIAEAEENAVGGLDAKESVTRALYDFKEPFYGAKDRLITSLSAMVEAYYAAVMLSDVNATVAEIIKK